VTIIQRLATSSLIYTLSNLLQKGMAFLLIPVYTHYLNADGYGILSVVAALNGFLAVFFTLSLHGAMTRFYFDYRDQPETLKSFWGTQLTFILLVSTAGGGALLITGQWVLAPVIGDVPYMPYVVLGIFISMFQPVFQTLLALLQTREQPLLYAVLNLANFVITIALAISLVVFWGWGAEGPLFALLAAAAITFVLSLWILRHEVRFGIQKEHLRTGLRYSLPLVPHALAGVLTAMLDRLLINGLVGMSAAGVYALAFQLATVVAVITDSVNRAYFPVVTQILKDGDSAKVDELPRVALYMVGAYCAAALGLSVFAPEIVALVAPPAFGEAASAVPLIAFAFALNGVYYIYVNILFYRADGTRLIPLATVVGGAVSIGANLFLIPRFGIAGASMAMVVAQLVSVVFVALIARKYEVVQWPARRFAYLVGGGLLLAIASQQIKDWSLPAALLAKGAIVAAGMVALFVLSGGSPRAVRDAIGALRRT